VNKLNLFTKIADNMQLGSVVISLVGVEMQLVAVEMLR
jgi:hypothetical protein